MKYFSGETPRRGDVVQRVAVCQEPHKKLLGEFGFRFGDLAFVESVDRKRFLFPITISVNDCEYSISASSWPEVWQLVSRGKI